MTVKNFKQLTIKKGTRVILRLDCNVPIVSDGKTEKITNTFRLDSSIPTIQALQKKGAKVVILAHREEGTLKAVATYLKKKVPAFSYLDQVVGEKALAKVESLAFGEVLLLENLRSEEGEKKGDKDFAKALAAYGEVYINDAFSASHRNHASIAVLPKLVKEKGIGPLFEKEVKSLDKALAPKKPLLFILGGAKFDTKIKLLKKYSTLADSIFVGGALAHSFWHQAGYELGRSLRDDAVVLDPKLLKSKKIILPADVMLEDRNIALPTDIKKNAKVVDFGPATLAQLEVEIKKAKTIVWNGPLGYYEGGYDAGTKALLKVLGKQKGKVVILGGGDTVSVLESLTKKDKTLVYTHVSTGGGAMIDYLSSGTLPGLTALK